MEHSKPILTLVERQKKKVIKTLEGWVNVYDGDEFSEMHKSKETADQFKSSDRRACVHIKQDYEVEE